jgi:predicted Fe-S protein YdhL (DUF1289 family)
VIDALITPTEERNQPPLPPSPCVGICALRQDYCFGCGRTSDEIAAWGGLSRAEQSAVWAKLPGRLAEFGFKTFRLAAGAAVVGDFIGLTFTESTGRWRLVSASVEASMTITADARPEIEATDTYVSAASAGGDQLTLMKHDKVRVFGFASDLANAQLDTVALVLPKGRAQRDLKEDEKALASGTMHAGLPELFAESWVVQSTATENALAHASWPEKSAALNQTFKAGETRGGLRNALGRIDTSNLSFSATDARPDANAPENLKISKAFVACAIFHAADPEWLAAALAP